MKVYCAGGFFDGEIMEVDCKKLVAGDVVYFNHPTMGTFEYLATENKTNGLMIVLSKHGVAKEPLKPFNQIVDVAGKRDKKLEKEARKLRDKVYGKLISDDSWESVANNWMNDIEWLREQTI